MWSNILNWSLEFISKIGDFANWLFEPITLADWFASRLALVGNVFGGQSSTILEVVREWFNTKADWAYNISFTPIVVISTSGLVFCVLFSLLNKVNFFG